MPPKDCDPVIESSLGIIPPKRRNAPLKTGDNWLEDKKDLEGAEGLWRIHDDIYDLTEFVEKHPGGSQWLNLTKGTDITEAFEVHHLSDLPETILKKYYVRKASTKRNNPFTFKDDGFYRTLKREFIKDLKKAPKHVINHTAFVTDCMVLAMFLVCIITVRTWNYWLCPIAGYLVTSTAICSHNFLHKKDNFRMYFYTFSLMQLREWRIIHALSHHLHTNTVNDLEISNLEPMLQYLPIEKSLMSRYGPMFYSPILWGLSFHNNLIKRTIQFAKGQTSHLGWPDVVPFILPAMMYFMGGQSFLATIWMWNCIIFCGSMYFEFVGLNAAHHHPDIFHDGDAARSTTDYDWGIHQLDAVMDRKDITGNSYLVLTTYGDHALHHLFPTLDHGVLEYMYPTFKRVLKQFNINLRMLSQLDMIKGQFKQLTRIEPHKEPPNLLKYDLLYEK